MKWRSPEDRQAYFADYEQRDSELNEVLLRDRVIIPSVECAPGYLYWGQGRSIGEVAICVGQDQSGQVSFEGLRNKLGLDRIFTEIHYDDNPSLGTWMPYCKWKKHPAFESEKEKMYWLLDANIEVLEARIQWHLDMPKHLQQAPSYDSLLEDSRNHLDALLELKRDGFSDTQTLSFRQILKSHSRVSD